MLPSGQAPAEPLAGHFAAVFSANELLPYHVYDLLEGSSQLPSKADGSKLDLTGLYQGTKAAAVLRQTVVVLDKC